MTTVVASERPTLDAARAALRARFGFPDFRPGQERAVSSVLAGRDTLVVLPTGGGKSVCYQVPALVLPGLTVVVSPLISLMKDQVDALTARGIPATFVNSTLTSGEVSERMTRVMRGEIKLLYLAPERFDVGITAAAYHAGLDDRHRHAVQDAFMNESVRAIVATNAFGMGIDKPNVRLVVHHAMPGTLEAYYQEAGRAGRDGKPSEVYLLHAFPDRFTHEFFIKGAYPERPLVEKVYQRACTLADKTGSVSLEPASIAASLPGKVSDREVESALRVLIQTGAIRSEPESGRRVFVRLLATPDRIKRELGTERALELGLLRALWRVAGDALNDGVPIDLDGLPPGFGGAVGTMPLLAELERGQFLEWHRLGGGEHVTNPRRPLSAFPYDWTALERRRKNELSKLDAVQQYAYATGCRRGFVLRYFGDPAAGKDCGGCDNCLGTHDATRRQKVAPAPKPGEKRKSRGAAPGAQRREPVELVASPADAQLLERLRA